MLEVQFFNKLILISEFKKVLIPLAKQILNLANR